MNKKCFLITGASSGLGKAMKDFLLTETNHDVISLSRQTEPTDATYRNLLYVYLDLSLVKNFDFVSNICKSYIDSELIFINNAATILPLEKTGSFTSKEISSYYYTNVIAQVNLINRLIAVRKHNFTLLNISSGAAKKAIKSWSLYCSAKAALYMFCEVLAIDHPEIRVKNIDPGVINTRMQEHIRNSNIPDLNIFEDLNEKSSLKDPINTAKEILKDYV